jgi:hypothetical protein
VFILVILRYKSKTSNVKTILFNLAKLLTTLTAIYKIIFLINMFVLELFFLRSYIYSITVRNIALLALYYYRPSGNSKGPKQRTTSSGRSLPCDPDQGTKEEGACPSYKHLL